MKSLLHYRKNVTEPPTTAIHVMHVRGQADFSKYRYFGSSVFTINKTMEPPKTFSLFFMGEKTAQKVS
jgi:hypothetical protein